MIKAIFFDVGHTLIHPARSTTEVCQHMLAQHGYGVDRDAVRSAMRFADTAHMARYHALGDDWAQQRTIVALWLRYYKDVFDRLGVTDADDQLAHRMIHWYGQPAAWQLFPDVLETVAQLKAQDFCLGAVSDWGDTLTAILHAHRVSPYLDFVLGSGTIGFCKPSIQFFRLALDRAAVAPHEAIHVGDSYYADVRGARAAGIAPVLIDRAGHAPPLDCPVIRNVGELPALLQAVGSHTHVPQR